MVYKYTTSVTQYTFFSKKKKKKKKEKEKKATQYTYCHIRITYLNTKSHLINFYNYNNVKNKAKNNTIKTLSN